MPEVVRTPEGYKTTPDPTPVGTVSLVYRPGGIAGGNVYTDWNALMAAHGAIQGQKIIEVDNGAIAPLPAKVPAGAYDLSDTTLVGGRSNVLGAPGTTVLQFLDGAVVTRFPPVVQNLILSSVSTSPVVVQSVVGPPLAIELDGALVQSEVGAVPMFSIPVGGAAITFNCMNRGGTGNAGFPVVDLSAPGALATFIIDFGGQILEGTVSGIAASGVAVQIRSPSNSMLNSFGPPFLGGATIVLDAIASQAGYTPAVSANWVAPDPTNIAEALDRIAAMVGPIA